MKTLYTISDVEKIPSNIDGIIVGTKFSLRVSKRFNNEEIKQLLSKNLEVFINVDMLFTDNDLKAFESFFKLFKDENCKWIFSDFAVYEIALAYHKTANLVYNGSTLVANYQDVLVFKDLGIYGVFPSKELSLADLQEITFHKELAIFVIGFGYYPMFHSKRKLIFTDIKKDKMFLKEELRQDFYPLVEDSFGTHIFRAKPASLDKYIAEIACDYYVIDNFLVDDNLIQKVLQKKPLGDAVDTGFLFQKTIYRKGE